MEQLSLRLRTPSHAGLDPVPRCTARAARSAAPGQAYLSVGDALGLLLADVDLGRLYPDQSPPLRPELMALATVLQDTERLSDEAAARAIAQRVEWRYALHQPLDRQAPAAGELAEFRRRLAADEEARRAFSVLLRRLHMIGLLRRRVSTEEILRRLDHTNA